MFRNESAVDQKEPERRPIGVVEGNHHSLDHQGRHDKPDPDPDEEADNLGDTQNERHPTQLLDSLQHEEFVDHLRLTQHTDAEDEEETESDRKGDAGEGLEEALHPLTGQDRARHPADAATRFQGLTEHQQGADQHYRPLNQVGIDAGH